VQIRAEVQAGRSISARSKVSLLPSAIPVAVLQNGMLSGAQGPVPVVVSRGTRSASAWAWEFAAWDQDVHVRYAPDDPDPDYVTITRLLVQQLDDDAASDEVTIEVPPIVECTMVDPLVDDPPDSAEVQVCPDDFSGEAAARAVIVRNGIAVWVTLARRSHVRSGTVRVPVHLQVLTGEGGSGDPLAVVSPPTDAVDLLASARRRGRLARITTGLGRALARAPERALRWAFGAPELAARVGLSHPGDEDDKTIALHPAALERIGAQSGDQVILRWGSVERVVTAIADHSPPAGGSAQPANGSSDRLLPIMPPFPRNMPPHLAARVPAVARHAMDLPVAAIVTVRRNTPSVLLSNLHRLVIPLASLVLAGASLEDPNWWLLGSGTLLMSVFALTRLRMPGGRSFSTDV
jgi:hypothetical protein